MSEKQYGPWRIRYSPYWAEAKVERSNGTLVEEMPMEEAHRRLNECPTAERRLEGLEAFLRGRLWQYIDDEIDDMDQAVFMLNMIERALTAQEPAEESET